jgi:hypothetical protein
LCLWDSALDTSRVALASSSLEGAYAELKEFVGYFSGNSVVAVVRGGNLAVAISKETGHWGSRVQSQRLLKNCSIVNQYHGLPCRISDPQMYHSMIWTW